MIQAVIAWKIIPESFDGIPETIFGMVIPSLGWHSHL